MDKILLRQYFMKLNHLEGEEYILSVIKYGAAPTLKKVKPASLISFSKRGKNLYDVWKVYGKKVCELLNLHFFELKEEAERVLVLFFDHDMLERHISREQNLAFLKRMGYDCRVTLSECLEFLKLRFQLMCPHEIGIFLGIPAQDVHSFIEHKGANFLFCKYWKVYHNPEKAKRLFDCYDKAKTSIICSMINEKSCDSLAV